MKKHVGRVFLYFIQYSLQIFVKRVGTLILKMVEGRQDWKIVSAYKSYNFDITTQLGKRNI